MTVHFIGAGPGAADLLTLRGRDLIAACPVCLYAGSLVPEGVLAHCPSGARIVNTAPLSLDEIIAEITAAHADGKDVARLHSGDLSIWSAMGEQLRRLRALGIPFTVTPGVPSFSAAAAAARGRADVAGSCPVGRADAHAGPRQRDARGREARCVRRDRRGARHSSVDPSARQGRRRADAALRRGLPGRDRLARELAGPAHRPRHARDARCRRRREMERTALILVGKTLGAADFDESRLYAADYDRRYRPVGAEPRFPEAS